LLPLTFDITKKIDFLSSCSACGALITYHYKLRQKKSFSHPLAATVLYIIRDYWVASTFIWNQCRLSTGDQVGL